MVDRSAAAWSGVIFPKNIVRWRIEGMVFYKPSGSDSENEVNVGDEVVTQSYGCTTLNKFSIVTNAKC